METRALIAVVLSTLVTADVPYVAFDDAKHLCSMATKSFKKCQAINPAGGLLAISYGVTCSGKKRINKCTIKDSETFKVEEPDKAQVTLLSDDKFRNTPWFQVIVQASMKTNVGYPFCCQVSCYPDSEGIGECKPKGKLQIQSCAELD